MNPPRPPFHLPSFARSLALSLAISPSLSLSLYLPPEPSTPNLNTNPTAHTLIITPATRKGGLSGAQGYLAHKKTQPYSTLQ